MGRVPDSLEHQDGVEYYGKAVRKAVSGVSTATGNIWRRGKELKEVRSTWMNEEDKGSVPIISLDRLYVVTDSSTVHCRRDPLFAY